MTRQTIHTRSQRTNDYATFARSKHRGSSTHNRQWAGHTSKTTENNKVNNKVFTLLFTPVGSEICTKTEGHPLLTHRSAAFETK
jgi:hypothetical protein